MILYFYKRLIYYQFFLEYPHKFTSKLKGQSVVEHDKCEFEIDVEASDADVTWCHNGKPIQADDTRYKYSIVLLHVYASNL